eukprot:jgi/Tetstr1/424949/TSEL_015442.t1
MPVFQFPDDDHLLDEPQPLDKEEGPQAPPPMPPSTALASAQGGGGHLRIKTSNFLQRHQEGDATALPTPHSSESAHISSPYVDLGDYHPTLVASAIAEVVRPYPAQMAPLALPAPTVRVSKAPRNYKEAISSNHFDDWKQSMDRDIASIAKMETLAPKAWFLRFSSFLRDFGFVSSDLTWLAVASRPDIAFVVGRLRAYMASPTERHWHIAVSVLRYLKGTPSHGLIFRKQLNNEAPDFLFFVDADWATFMPKYRSTTGYLALVHGTPVAYRAQVQKSVAMSTAESEFVALCMACNCMAFIHVLLRLLNHPTTDPDEEG